MPPVYAELDNETQRTEIAWERVIPQRYEGENCCGLRKSLLIQVTMYGLSLVPDPSYFQLTTSAVTTLLLRLAGGQEISERA